MNTIKRIRSIIEGWYYYLISNRKKNELSDQRMLICFSCQHKNKKLNSCRECGCFLPAKTRVEDAECPHQYW